MQGNWRYWSIGIYSTTAELRTIEMRQPVSDRCLRTYCITDEPTVRGALSPTVNGI